MRACKNFLFVRVKSFSHGKIFTLVTFCDNGVVRYITCSLVHSDALCRHLESGSIRKTTHHDDGNKKSASKEQEALLWTFYSCTSNYPSVILKVTLTGFRLSRNET